MPHFEAAQYNPTRMTAHSRPPSGHADTGLRAMLADLGGFLHHLYARMTEDRTRQSASALTFVSLFALVPMLTVSYAILSMVPDFEALDEQIQDFVFRHFVPSTGAEVQQYLRGELGQDDATVSRWTLSAARNAGQSALPTSGAIARASRSWSAGSAGRSWVCRS